MHASPSTLLQLAIVAIMASTPVAGTASPARVQWELDATLASLNEQGHLYRDDGQPLEITTEPRLRWELGAVLDVAAEGDGLPVLAVTPGGGAARMGLAVGDRVVAINGETRLGGAGTASRLAEAVGARSGDLVLDIVRGDRQVELRGTADAVSIPGYRMRIDAQPAPGSTCGQISLQTLNSPRDWVFPVRLVAINGRAIFDTDRTLYTLEPGIHEITLDELVPSYRFTRSALLDRAREQRAGRTRKTMVLDVRAGVSYRLAARLHPDRLDDIDEAGYWDPVVVRHSLQRCVRGGLPPVNGEAQAR